jgi:alpha,alpha-trehalase
MILLLALLMANAFAAPCDLPLGFKDGVELRQKPAAILLDPASERARALSLYEDFKILSDLSERALTQEQKDRIEVRARRIAIRRGERAGLKFRLTSLYEYRPELSASGLPEAEPQWTVNEAAHKPTVDHIEKMWNGLIRKTPARTNSSLIPLPHPFFISGARFQEGYYWDSYFVMPSLLRTGRERLVRGQIDNFLFLIENYGLVPNGNRDYYLSRSQPPLLTQMICLYIEHKMIGGLKPEILDWIRTRAFPLAKRDYENFWMNKGTRYDPTTGLNMHYDSLNVARLERHSSDQELAVAKTYRDVRAEAESGKDFTDAFEGEATNVAGVMLNSILYQVERDLAFMAMLLGDHSQYEHFQYAAGKRQHSINKYLWDTDGGIYRDFNLRTRKRSAVITADTFLPLHFAIASGRQAELVREKLPVLERDGGLMSSERKSGKQWDAPYGWAPHHYFAISGLRRYGFLGDAVRLAAKWVRTIDRAYSATGKIIEKIDAVRGAAPVEEGDKYVTQDGFLWTNGVYLWALTDILGVGINRSQLTQHP